MKKTDKKLLSFEHKKYLAVQKRKKIYVLIVQLLILFGFFALWELSAQQNWIDSFTFSCPSKIWETFLTLCNEGDLGRHIWTTLSENTIGFAISTIAGTFIAIVLWWSPYVRKVLEPYIVVLNSLPKVALGPVILIIFGLGIKAIVAMAVLIGIVITIINMETAFLSVDKEKLLLMKSLGANKFQTLTKLVLPYSVPAFMSNMKINIGLSWVGTIMGEFLTSNEGIGYLIENGRQWFKMSTVMTCTIILCVLASSMYFLLALLEKCFTKYSE